MSGPIVTVRMYRGLQDGAAGKTRGLLGDCFLLRLEDGPARSHILIDCGVLQGTPDARATMTAIAADIRAACDGHLDLVVATHEHADHLSGFAHAAETFFGEGGIAIGEVWYAWTEDPDDAQANQLRARFDRTRATVSALAGKVAERPPASPFAAAPAAALSGLDAFLGDDTDTLGLAAQGDGRSMTRIVLDTLRVKAGRARYLDPGDSLATPGAVSLPVVALGPPRGPLLFKNLPTKSGDETYLTDDDLVARLLTAALEGAEADRAALSPFAPSDRRLPASAVRAFAGTPSMRAEEVVQWCRRHYYDTTPPGRAERGGDTDQSRRRIDGDWLAAAGRFALKLDSDTNNTSLVLAFRLPDDSFMLFAGDAQVGNWESWHDQLYTLGGVALTATDVLGRTRLYKVGHHGSHNATLKDRGLALMTHPALVAMMSTDEDFARAPGRGWQMPAPATRRALLDATNGRLIRGDRRWAEDDDVRGYPRSRDFTDRLDEKADLYVEYRLGG